MSETVLKVENLRITFTSYSKGLHKNEQVAISNLHATINKSEILAVVGASGSGKSLLAHSILGILPANAKVSGNIYFYNKKLSETEIKKKRGKEIAFIPQSVSCLNPLMKIKDFAGSKACSLFSRYGLSKEVKQLYPHQLSGGMARRVLISCAASTDASLIIADEPTAGLNEKLAHETLKHLRELANEGRAILLITHDIFLATQYAEKVCIMNEGKTIETLSTDDLINGRANNEFTKLLWQSLPENDFI